MPEIGDLALCGANTLGLITENEKQEVTYSEGTKGIAWVGIHLTNKLAKIGSPWSSKKPIIVGHITELTKNMLQELELANTSDPSSSFYE